MSRVLVKLEGKPPSVVEKLRAIADPKSRAGYALVCKAKWEEIRPSRGLGDVIAKGLRKIGIKKKCGKCARRQEKLNRAFPFRSK